MLSCSKGNHVVLPLSFKCNMVLLCINPLHHVLTMEAKMKSCVLLILVLLNSLRSTGTFCMSMISYLLEDFLLTHAIVRRINTEQQCCLLRFYM